MQLHQTECEERMMSRSGGNKTEDVETRDLVLVEGKSSSFEKQMDGSNMEVECDGGRSHDWEGKLEDCSQLGIIRNRGNMPGDQGLKLYNSIC